jgi:hypothetical protein
MANWVVSAHGGAVKSSSKIRQILAPTKKFEYDVTYVPGGMELVMFTSQGMIFYGGDPELDALIDGRENDAVITQRMHKIKKPKAIVPNYRAYGTTDFRSGVYEVGSKGQGKIVMALPNNSVTPLTDIFAEAKKAGVQRIYWLCCSCMD